MPITFSKEDNRYYGLSTDAKPTNVKPCSKFFEVDMGCEFIFLDGVWVSYKDFRTALAADAKPLTAPNGAKLLTVDNGTWFVCHNNTWYPQ